MGRVGSPTYSEILGVSAANILNIGDPGVVSIYLNSTTGVGLNSVLYQWPANQGAASTYLKNDGAGNLTWATGSGGISYPGAGVAVSTGAAWGTSLSNGSSLSVINQSLATTGTPSFAGLSLTTTPLAVGSGGTAATSASAARTSLGVTATGSDTTYNYRANNLSDVANAATAATNLGLGSSSSVTFGQITLTSAPLGMGYGGTNAINAAAALTNFGFQNSGAYVQAINQYLGTAYSPSFVTYYLNTVSGLWRFHYAKWCTYCQ